MFTLDGVSARWYGSRVHRAAWLRWISLALVLGVMVLHLPLDVFRAAPSKDSTSSCCPRLSVGADDACQELVVQSGATAPVPKDGCDQGCHCGCCGGLPIFSETGSGPVVDRVGTPSVAPDRQGARHDRPLDVFHPPRA